MSFVAGMRSSGKSAIGCNIYIRALNALFHWAGQKPIPKLKAEDEIPPTFSASDLQKLLKFKPSKRQARTHLLTLLLLDTGLRISEALSLKVSDVDLDNMLFSVRGKPTALTLSPQEQQSGAWRACLKLYDLNYPEAVARFGDQFEAALSEPEQVRAGTLDSLADELLGESVSSRDRRSILPHTSLKKD